MTVIGETGCELGILAVDDDESNLLLLQRMLERAGYAQVATTRDPCRAIELFAEMRPALVLLDLHMRGMDGFELMDRLSSLAGDRDGPAFLILTGDGSEEAKQRALSNGARDFLTKPFSHAELVLRVRNLLEVELLHNRLRDQNATLEVQVAERTSELEEARLETLARLALAAEYRDDDTQQHAWRIGRCCAQLATAIGLADWQIELIEQAAPLHDIGKIGIPDAVLLKPGKLTPEEFELIKTHTTIGAAILSESRSPVLRLAERIALTHHERWDGTGYPQAHAGGDIPLAGRITAIADVFDALTHERPYKRAWPVQDAVDEIMGQRGRQFDPGLIDAFSTLDHDGLLQSLTDATSWTTRFQGQIPLGLRL